MKIYDVLTESITPCGVAKYAIREFSEVETDDPESYIAENGRYPIIDCVRGDGDTVITTGDGNGYIVRYVFTE